MTAPPPRGTFEGFRFSTGKGTALLADERENAIDPNSSLLCAWHHVLLACTLYEAFVLPFFVTFKPNAPREQPKELYAAIACELVFFADVIVQAHTGYYNDGNVVKDRRKTRRRYLQSCRFALDVFTLTPFSFLVVVPQISRAALEMHKLVRWIKVPEYVATIDNMFAKRFVLLKILKMVIVTIFLSHFVACLRFSFGYKHDDNHHGHWLPVEPPPEARTVQRQYLASIFWAFGLMSGLFEGELPTKTSEFVFTQFVATCGFSLFTTLCAMFFMISKCESGNSEADEARRNQLKHVLSFHRVPEELQTQAIEYLIRYHSDADSNDREVLKLLCPSITQDIQVELLKDTVARIPLFEGCDDKFIRALTSLLELISLPAQTTVFQSGDYGDSMFIVNSGVFSVIVNGVTVREMRKGSYFGELSVFQNSPRSATVLSITYSTLYRLTKFHGERLLEGYPECATTISMRLTHLARRGGDRKTLTALTTSSSTLTKFDFKRFDASGIGAKIRLRSSVTPIISWGKKSSYVLPGLEDAERKESPQVVKSVSLQVADMPDERRASLDKHGRLKSYYDQNTVQVNPSHDSPAWGKLLFKRCVDAESRARMWWLLVLELVVIYNWILIPLRLCFPVFKRPMWYIDAANVITDMALLVDIYLNFNLSYVEDAEKIMDPTRSAIRYARGGFVLDCLSMLPFWILSPSHSSSFARIPRLLRCRNWLQHYLEVSSFLRLTNRGRLMILCLFLVALYHLIACAHFGFSNVEGFSADNEAWIPSDDIFLEPVNSTHYRGKGELVYSANDSELYVIAARQYFRSLYYATNVLAALGKTIEPDSELQYWIALELMLSGFLITAIAVDNVQKRFTASAYEQKQFYSMRTKIQLFLRRQTAPDSIFQRVNSFLDFWWSSHRGAFVGELIADLPAPLKLEVLRSICAPALQTLSLLSGVRSVLDKLEEFFVTHAQIILYGQGEVVYRQGDYANGLFFLLVGEVCVISNAQDPRTIPVGSFFGSAALKPTTASHGYGEHVSATMGSILLFVSKDHLVAMESIFAGFSSELTALESKLLRNKLMNTGVSTPGSRSSARQSMVAATPVQKRTFCERYFAPAETAFDPDSKLVILWETWVFIAMTVQWLTVTIQTCFRMKKERYVQADAITASLELSFFVDLYMRTRLGYYAYGNKIMDPPTIRRTYFHSRAFLIDVLSLTPLYVVNWIRPVQNRLDGLNVNKVIRLFKVPGQLRALENRYLKRTTELRLFKLFYYTFLLAHMFGCMWFDFASNSSRIFNTGGTVGTEFGQDAWLPPVQLGLAPLNVQYFSSIFWSFGLMSASSTGELPKSTHECIFSVITMTSGFFLFAYVIGNFADIIELADGGNREFVERLSAIRLLLSHFSLPKSIEDRLKTYYCFQRFHTITQERHLERCFPPSLLTDLRLVHLKPMIAKVSFLSGMEGSVTRMLVSQFHQQLVLREEYVCKYGDEGFDMYFVFTGILDVLLPSNVRSSEDENQHQHIADRAAPVGILGTEDLLIGRLKKVSELTAGSYFGENGLFMKSLRNAYIRASTSCILYKLSRDSLELVFERYPLWKEKVLRIANLQREQNRLARMSADEQNRHSDEASGSMLSRIDLINLRAEQMEEEMQFVRLRRMKSTKDVSAHTLKARRLVGRVIQEPVMALWTSLTVGTDAQSPIHREWLRMNIFCSVFAASVIPYRIAVDPLSHPSPFNETLKAVEVFCEVMFVLDIRFSWRVRECANSMELYEERYKAMYFKERLLWDVVSACPLDRLLAEFTSTSWLRLLRCVKMVNVWSYMEELNRRSVSNELNRFRGVCLIYVMAIYWAACSYLSISAHAGFVEEWNSWRPAKSLAIIKDEAPSTEVVVLRLLRGLFFGITCFVKKGKTFTPDTTALNIFTVLMCFVGMLVMSFMISEFAALFISYIWNEVDYRKNQIAVELYVDRIRVSRELKQRTQRFMSSLWSSHSGVNYEAILADMPESIRSDAIIHIVHRPLRLFASSTFRLLACDSRPDLDALTHKLAQSLRFEGYPRDENVVSEGSISRGMFFVVRGHLVMSSLSNAQMPRSIIRKGQYFGDRGLLGCVVSAFTVRTVRSCDLLSLSSEAFLKVLEQNAFSDLALTVTKRAQQRLTESAAAECSREEMEGHWGKVLLTELRMVQQSLDTSRDTRLSRTHIDRLVSTVQDAADCMRIFQSFLCVVLPFDPLDWTAAVGNVLAKRHAQSPASALWMEPPFSLGPVDTLSDTAHQVAVGETPRRGSRLTATDVRRIDVVSASGTDAASALTGMTQPPTIGDTTTNPIPAGKVNADDTESLMSEILDALTAPRVGADGDRVATASNGPM